MHEKNYIYKSIDIHSGLDTKAYSILVSGTHTMEDKIYCLCILLLFFSIKLNNYLSWVKIESMTYDLAAKVAHHWTIRHLSSFIFQLSAMEKCLHLIVLNDSSPFNLPAKSA